MSLLLKLQTASGGLVIPLIGGVWLFALIFMFLSPTREATFRSQESLDDFNVLLLEAVNKKINPAIESWKRIGEQIEQEMKNGLLDNVKKAVEEIRGAARKIEDGNGDLKKFTEDAKPVVKALRELHEQIEKKNMLHEIVEGAKAIRMMGSPLPPVSTSKSDSGKSEDPEIDVPKVGKALDMVKKKA
jgi:hypothetical protein